MNTRSIGMQSILAAVTLVLCGCATTTFDSTWKNSQARPLQLSGRKVAAVFVTRDPLLRRRYEDAMTREITARGAIGVPSYTFATEREIQDAEAAQRRADDLGFSGAVVMRVVGMETHHGHVSGGVMWASSPYHRLWGDYWRWGWGVVWEPTYLSVDRSVKVETLVYSLDDDQLVWAGVTRTIHPERVDTFVSELAAAISDRMAKEGLVTRD